VGPWLVVDLFSGAGGMSCGFHRKSGFAVVGAVDAQIGKPSVGAGSLGCNATYAANIGFMPVEADLDRADPATVCDAMGLTDERPPTVLAACPPCTGFTRTIASNHLRDDRRNSLVRRIADYAALLRPDIVLIENARELVTGRFGGHLRGLLALLGDLGYQATVATHYLTDFGLPQRRERAIIVAARGSLPVRGLTDLWRGWRVDAKATHVRRAIWDLPPARAGEPHEADPLHVSPAFRTQVSNRLAATPPDGGGWADLVDRPDSCDLLTPAITRRVARGDFGSHPDIYGRMWWDRPAPTIKRECSHVGNGRYAHPEQNRLCTVREMSILQGFPHDYQFAGPVANMYRHIGDAVPPLISYQLAGLCGWILGGARPDPADLLLPGCQLTTGDLLRT
jgi:DNA (cytosine-5)-methyltransferase 1